MKLTGAQMVCESLIREGVDTMFGIPGGAILPLYQTFHEYPQLKHMCVTFGAPRVGNNTFKKMFNERCCFTKRYVNYFVYPITIFEKPYKLNRLLL